MATTCTSMLQTYQLHICLDDDITIDVGKLGQFHFPAGHYVYTGSAKRNLEARVQRHLRKEIRLRWHIDYLLAHKAANITSVDTFSANECRLNQKTNGDIIVKGFGASDCRKGCGSHLKKIP